MSLDPPSKPFYVDPASNAWPRPNLISGLMAAPATATLRPLERQATIVLAWLANRSRVFADALLEMFLEGDEQALAVTRGDISVIGARAWGTLRPLPGTGSMYPDLTIAGSDRTFELIVEIKIDAEEHTSSVEGLFQVDGYLRSWLDNYDHAQEAGVRRIGTLTMKGSTREGIPAVERAQDVTWKSVRDLLAGQLEAAALESTVVAVATDAVAAIDERILRKARPTIDDPVISWGYDLLTALAPLIAARLPGGSVRRGVTVQVDYTGVYVYFRSDECDRKLWLYVTLPEGRYNVEEHDATLWIGEETTDRWPLPVRQSLAAHGVEDVKDRDGWRSHRFAIDVANVQSAGDQSEQVAYALNAALPRLRGLTS